ncbi:hypothetical protein pb186bvf_000961 [Paramecium bursaria]
MINHRENKINLPINNFHDLFNQIQPFIDKPLYLKSVPKDSIQQLNEAIEFLQKEGTQIMKRFIEFEDLTDEQSSFRDEIQLDNLNDKVIKNYNEAEQKYVNKEHKNTVQFFENAQQFHKCIYDIQNNSYLIEQAKTLQRINLILQQDSQFERLMTGIQIEQMQEINKIALYIQKLIQYLKFSTDMKINYLENQYQPINNHINITTIITQDKLSLIYQKDKNLKIYYYPIARRAIISMLGDDEINYEEIIQSQEELIIALGQLLQIKVETNIQKIMSIIEELQLFQQVYKVECDYFYVKQNLFQ